MLRVALISLYILESNGIRYLASSLRHEGVETDEIYLDYFIHHHYQPPDERQIELLIDLLRRREVGLVGISLRAGAYLPICKELTRRIREELSILVVWGGAHVSMDPEQCLEHHDLLVLGEAERAICELARAVKTGGDLTGLPNVWVKQDGREFKNELRPLVQDLDELPFPDFHSHDSKFWIRHHRVIPGEPLADERIYRIMASRGCPYNCAFCGVSAFRRLYDKQGGGFYRMRTVDNCLAEITQARANLPRLRRIRFDDELFVPNKKWLTEFAEKYKKQIGLPFDILSNPRCLNEWTVSTLRDAGLDAVFIGVQSTAISNEKLYNRYVADERIVEIARRLKRHSVRGMFQVLIDDPMNTAEEKQNLLELLLKLPRPYDLFVYSLCHWPGSARTRQLLADGLIGEDQVEGADNKVLRQFNADFSYKRSPENTLYLALYLLANKWIVPRSLIRRWARSPQLRRNPRPVVTLAVATNLLKLFFEGTRMLLKGDISMHVVRRWMTKQNLFSFPSI